MELTKPGKTANKFDDDNIVIPTTDNYDILLRTNYNGQQLRKILKLYKLKLSGNKKQLVLRIYCFLKLSSFIIKIQKVFRGNLQRLWNHYHGPALFNRKLCTNDTDFLTTEKIETLPASQFFSYQDTDKFIYGFDIISLHNLIIKSGKTVKNPYNRSVIQPEVINMLKNLIKISKALKFDIEIDIKENEMTNEKSLELRILDLFQTIDSLGNYSNPSWFTSLNAVQLVRFVRELNDIWVYRAQLSAEVKRQICPPNGDPFQHFSVSSFNINNNINIIRKNILVILEKLVNSGSDVGNKALGAYYVLGALTIVNEEAALALPWLFQSLVYF